MIVRISAKYLSHTFKNKTRPVFMFARKQRPNKFNNQKQSPKDDESINTDEHNISGFGKFQRKKITPESKKKPSIDEKSESINNTSQQQQKEKDDMNSFTHKAENQKQTNMDKSEKSAKGFSNFKRKVSKQQDSIQDKKSSIQGNKTETSQHHFSSANNQIHKGAKEERKKNQTTQRIQIPKAEVQGFKNFKRKSALSQTKKTQQIKPEPQQKDPIKQDSSFSSEAEKKVNKENQDREAISGFKNFARKTPQSQNKEQSGLRGADEPQQKQNKEKQSLSGFNNFEQRNMQGEEKNQKENSKDVDDQRREPEKKQKYYENRKPILGFNNFVRRTPEPKNKQQGEKQQQKLSEEQKGEPKVQKTAQQLQKQELERKQAYFMQKVNEFKRIKHNEEERLKNPFSQQKIRQFFKIPEHLKPPKIDPPPFVKKNPILYNFYLIAMKLGHFIALALLMYLFANWLDHTQVIESYEALEHIDRANVHSITFITNIIPKGEQIGRKEEKDAILLLKDSGKRVSFICTDELEKIVKDKLSSLQIAGGEHVPVFYTRKQNSPINQSIRTLLGLYLFYLILSSFRAGISAKKGGKGGSPNMFDAFGEKKSKRFRQDVNIFFKDVVGMQKAKEEIVEFIDFLKNPQKYQKLGAKIPKGALLTGPPGTGKTMIAKACAGESSVPFFTVSGSQFMEMYVGVGAQRVRQLFKQAKENSPSIIFIDEIDAVGKKRASGMGGGNDQRDNTLNQLLVELDGFNTDTNVIVFAATNQKDVLDPALTRPGRFDRLVQVDLPDIEGRKQIFKVHLKPIVIDKDSQIEEYARRMATLTPGFSGAEIRNLCNEAAIVAAREGHKFVTMHDFEMATERVIGGVEKKSSLITPETKKVVAYHECGHGVCSWFLEGANPLLKLTIIPRSKGALGFAQYLPYQSQISTRKQLEDQICVILGGRVSEQIFFKKISTGAYDDLQKAYQVAKMIVTQYGMDDKLGWLRYEQTQYTKMYSKETERLIDQEIINILKRCTQRTRELITSKRQIIQKLAEKLLEKQTIDQNMINQILGDRPFKPSKQYQQYLKEKKKVGQEELITFKPLKRIDYLV